MINKEYLYSLKNYFWLAFIIFLFAISCGYFLAQTLPQDTELVLEEVKKVYQPLLEMSSFSQLLAIFLNNALTSFFIILFGLFFGIFPFISLFANGFILGILAVFFPEKSIFLLGILPHGIIEIPLLILTGAIGFKIGKTVFQKLIKKTGEITIELSLGLECFLKVILPLLALAAAIEVFITARLLGI